MGHFNSPMAQFPKGSNDTPKGSNDTPKGSNDTPKGFRAPTTVLIFTSYEIFTDIKWNTTQGPTNFFTRPKGPRAKGQKGPKAKRVQRAKGPKGPKGQRPKAKRGQRVQGFERGKPLLSVVIIYGRF